MINESYYWKKELYGSFLTIAKFRQLKITKEQSFVNVEKALMIGAFIIRKLDDGEKIPPDFLERKVTLDFSKSKGTIVDHMNWHKLDNHYDLDKIVKIEKDWRFIINQFIHSFTFFFSYDNTNKLDGFLINSDKTKKEALFFLPLKNLLTFFLTVSEGVITSESSYRQSIKDKNGIIQPGEMRLKNATYTYLSKLNIEKEISETLKGNIYKRGLDEI
jgi:hypothetical protein